MVKITSQRGKRAGLAAAGLAAIVGLGACQSPGAASAAFVAGAPHAPNSQVGGSMSVLGWFFRNAENNQGNANNGQNQIPIQVPSVYDSNSIIRCTYFTGDSYEGPIKNGKREGYGKFRWANGDYYEGMFREDELEGEGIWHGVKGETLKGIFYRGKYVGPVDNKVTQNTGEINK